MSRSKWKHSYTTNDITSFFLVNSNKIKTKSKSSSIIYYQAKNSYLF